MRIDFIKPENLDEIAKLHQQNLPYTASKIGQVYLRSLYKSIIQNPQTHLCIGAFENGSIVGLICGTKDLKKTQKIIKKGLSTKTYFAIIKALIMLKVTPQELFKKIKFENLLIKKYANPYPTILTFFVVEKYRKKGIGKKLLKKYIEKFRENQKKIYVDTLISNKNAQNFYQSNGFKMTGKIIDSFVFETSLKKTY